MKVFISHATADQEAAEKLAQSLRTLGFQVTHPSGDVLPGDNWSLKVGQALESSDAMISLLSPDSKKSPSIRREIEYALSSPRFEGRLIPVMLQKTEAYPWILRNMNIAPFNVKVIAGRLQSRPARKQLARPVRRELTGRA